MEDEEERSTKEEEESPDDFTEKNIQNKTPAEEDDEEEDQKEEEPIKIVRRPRRSSLQLPGKRRRSSMNIKEGGIKKGPRRMSSIEKRVRRLSLRRNSVNKGRRLSVRRMSAILRRMKRGPKKRRKKRKKKKKVARQLIPTDRFSLIRFLEADDVDVDDAMQWFREEQGKDEAGNVKWKSKDKSWAQNLVFYRDAEPPPPKPRPRAPGVCQWKGEDTEGNLYVCNNDCIRDRVTKQLTKYCGWHSPVCVCKHHDGRPNEVTHSNRHGMCDAHHLAIKNCLPVRVDPLDAPGT